MADLNSIGGIHYDMMRRCYSEKSVIYNSYGAKGITVCEEWHDRENFKTWARQNGYAKGMRLERIDTKGNYEPSNCRFGTRRKDKGVNSEIKRKRIERKERFKKYKIKENVYKSQLYRTYYGMLTRCYNINHTGYKYYGERGITVCDEWRGKNGFLEFNKWAIENGWQEKLTLDRIDVNKGYSPNNCRWVTWKEQNTNKRALKLYDYNNKRLCLKDISKIENISYSKLCEIMKKDNANIYDVVSKLKK